MQLHGISYSTMREHSLHELVDTSFLEVSPIEAEVCLARSSNVMCADSEGLSLK